MKIVIAAALAAAAVPAAAQARPVAAAAPAPAESGGEYRARAPAVQLALPNRVAEGSRTHNLHDVILDAPLLWAATATLREPVQVVADGATQELPAGTVLPMQLIGPADAQPIVAFCTPRRPSERAADRGVLGAVFDSGTLVRGIIRRATNRQVCLIDNDGDGDAESSVIIGDGSPAARRPREVAGAAYDFAELQPVGAEDRLRIKLQRIDRRGRWAEFELQIEQQGDRRRFDVLSGAWGSSNRITRVPVGADGEHSAHIVSTMFSVTAIDGTARTAEIAWSNSAPRDVPIVIPDRLQYIVRWR